MSSADLSAPAHALAWFEIPVSDFERAVRFYEAVFATTLRRQQILDSQLGIFPVQGDGINGALVCDQHSRPSSDGAVVYLSGGDDLAVALGRVAARGGAVLTPKTALPAGMGHFAHFRDTEGNRIGIWSQQ